MDMQQVRDHLTTGTKACVVCGHGIAGSGLTDFHGQRACLTCGATYQTIACKITNSLLVDIGIERKDVKLPYCDCIQIRDMLRDYWHSTHRKLPLGFYMRADRAPYTPEDDTAFYDFLAQHAERYRDTDLGFFDWDSILAEHRQAV